MNMAVITLTSDLQKHYLFVNASKMKINRPMVVFDKILKIKS